MDANVVWCGGGPVWGSNAKIRTGTRACLCKKHLSYRLSSQMAWIVKLQPRPVLNQSDRAFCSHSELDLRLWGGDRIKTQNAPGSGHITSCQTENSCPSPKAVPWSAACRLKGPCGSATGGAVTTVDAGAAPQLAWLPPHLPYCPPPPSCSTSGRGGVCSAITSLLFPLASTPSFWCCLQCWQSLQAEWVVLTGWDQRSWITHSVSFPNWNKLSCPQTPICPGLEPKSKGKGGLGGESNPTFSLFSGAWPSWFVCIP